MKFRSQKSHTVGHPAHRPTGKQMYRKRKLVQNEKHSKWGWKKGFKVLFYQWHPSTTGQNSHMVLHSDRRKKDGPASSTNLTHQCSFVTHSQLMKMIVQIYKRRPTLYKKRNPGFSSTLSVSTSNQEIPTGNTGTSFQLRDLQSI